MSTGAVSDAPKLLAERVQRDAFHRSPRPGSFCEVNIGWVPVVLESMDDHYVRDRIWTKTPARMPSTTGAPISRRRSSSMSGSATATDRARDDPWSTDYPHHRCDWLESQRIIAEHMQGVPAAEAAAMCAGNAARIYGIAAQ
jgi:hypothetical protein